MFKRIPITLLATVLTLFVVACLPVSPRPDPATGASAAVTKKMVVSHFVDAINGQDFDRLDAWVAPNFVRRNQATPGLQVNSLDEFKTFTRQDATIFPDASIAIQALVEEDDLVGFWATFSGTQKGEMDPFPATNLPMEVDFGGYFRFDDGLIVEEVVTWDNLALLEQLGHMDGPGAPATHVDASGEAGNASAAANRATIEAFADALNRQDYDALDTLMAADVVRHSQATPGLIVESRDAFIQFDIDGRITFPDQHIALDTLVAEDDLVLAMATYTGTQDGPMGDLPPSGSKIILEFPTLFRLDNGLIVELWVTWDNLAFLSQLGLFPSPEENGAAASITVEDLVGMWAWERSGFWMEFHADGTYRMGKRHPSSLYDDLGTYTLTDGLLEGLTGAESGICRTGQSWAADVSITDEGRLQWVEHFDDCSIRRAPSNRPQYFDRDDGE